MTRVVGVYPLVPTRSFDEPLSYLVPESDEFGGLQVGSLVEIHVGNALRVGVVAEVDGDPPEGIRLRPVHRVIDEPPVLPELVRLAEWTADTCASPRTRALAMVVPPRFAAHARAAQARRRTRRQVVRRVPGATAGVAAGKRQRELAGQVPEDWTPVAQVLAELATTRATIRQMARNGLVELDEQLVLATPASSGEGDPEAAPDAGRTADEPPTLTPEQRDAVQVIAGAEDTAVQLYGITGAGKTEVYLHAIAAELARGRGAIVLVPEIALTPQTAGRFERRFPGQVEVLHSGIAGARRARALGRVRSGARRVVVGPRSAVFAPVEHLGIIVVDEEHDSSYKQESEPRYDARRVAFRRAHDAGARLLLASATPRAETFHGVRTVARLVTRPGGGRLAPLQLVDLREGDEDFPLTEVTAAALDATLRRNRKAIVLHNRRGYSPALHCDACGVTARCPNCDTALTLHGSSTGRGRLECHHCAHMEDAPTVCPACGSAALARLGAGTERLEAQLAERFGSAVHRLDSDAVGSARELEEVLGEFARPGPGILVGTQMVAKGHDFADVELAVVVDADAALAFPDFRAEERAFQLLMQVAGRAGRTALTAAEARVIVQTWQPEAAFIGCALAHDVDGFMAAELARRQELGWPPFSRLVRVLCSAPDEAVAQEWASVTAGGLRERGVGDVLGPARQMRIAGRFRRQVLIRTAEPSKVAALVRGFLQRTESRRRSANVRMLLDVDPQSLG